MWFFECVLTISRREPHITVIPPLGAIHIYLHTSNFAHFFLKKKFNSISQVESFNPYRSDLEEAKLLFSSLQNNMKFAWVLIKH